MKPLSEHIWIIDHPLAQEELVIIRDRKVGLARFRDGLVKLGTYIGYELASTMKTEVVKVLTPLAEADGISLLDRKHLVLVEVLRAAVPLIEGLARVFPEARLGFISARRAEKTRSEEAVTEFDIEVRYVNIPAIEPSDIVIVADPMMATGSTMSRIIGEVLGRGNPRRVIAVGVVATRAALERVLAEHPRTEIYVVSIDPRVDERGYIVPGLGDAGDRAFILPEA